MRGVLRRRLHRTPVNSIICAHLMRKMTARLKRPLRHSPQSIGPARPRLRANYTDDDVDHNPKSASVNDSASKRARDATNNEPEDDSVRNGFHHVLRKVKSSLAGDQPTDRLVQQLSGPCGSGADPQAISLCDVRALRHGRKDRLQTAYGERGRTASQSRAGSKRACFRRVSSGWWVGPSRRSAP